MHSNYPRTTTPLPWTAPTRSFSMFDDETDFPESLDRGWSSRETIKHVSYRWVLQNDGKLLFDGPVLGCGIWRWPGTKHAREINKRIFTKAPYHTHARRNLPEEGAEIRWSILLFFSLRFSHCLLMLFGCGSRFSWSLGVFISRIWICSAQTSSDPINKDSSHIYQSRKLTKRYYHPTLLFTTV